jgi:hypothetical protein
MGNPEQNDPEACAPPQEQAPAIHLTVVVEPASSKLPFALLFMVLFTFCLAMLSVPAASYGYYAIMNQ